MSPLSQSLSLGPGAPVAGSCTHGALDQRSCPTMICPMYRTTRATSGMIHVGHRGFRCPISLDAFSMLRSSWVSGPRSGPIVLDALPAIHQSFPSALTSTSGWKECGIVCETQTRLHSSVLGDQQCGTKSSESHNFRERENLETEKPRNCAPNTKKSYLGDKMSEK